MGASGETSIAAANQKTRIAPYSGAPKFMECVLRTCTYTGPVAVDETLVVTFPVQVLPGAAPVQKNVVRVSGGGAPSAAAETETTISAAPASFGLASGGETTALSNVQAGAHPDLTTTGAFNTESGNGATTGSAKDITDDLPAGFAGDLVDTPTCSASLFLKEECPIATQVGVTTQIAILKVGERATYLQPVYNLVPEPGEVAKIGFNINVEFHYVGDISVRAPGEGGAPCAASNTTACEAYGLKTTFYNATGGFVDYDGFSLTIWGVPASPIHNPFRFENTGEHVGLGSFGHSDNATEAPYFTNPTSCGGPLAAELHITSWQHPHESESPPAAAMPFGPIVGCDGLTMAPSLTAETTSDNAYSPTGFNLDTTVPQSYPDAQVLATPTLKKEVVTLPEGMTVNPSAGAGLASCSEAQYAEEGAPEKTAEEKQKGHGCPNASKLASVKIVTPSLKEEVEGSVFLATPAPRGEAGHNPFGSLLALYLVARVPDRGVLVKSPGLVQANETTGRLTTTFDGLPPLPFSLAKFEFNPGQSAPLVTPAACGDYTVTAELTPYSDPEGLPLQPLIPAVCDHDRHGQWSLSLGWCPAVRAERDGGYGKPERGVLQPAGHPDQP